jgi:stage V sporulation protein R
MPGAPSTELPPELLEHMLAIKAKAIEYGLSFHEVVYEVLPFDTMNQIAAYQGFPVRYPHWKWGMEYDSLSKRDAYGMGRIYEMVINNDPVYAYLQESNSVTDQKLVMAHVYGHADFFKNNFWFSKTNRKMMDEMANHATRVRRHIERQGQETVERFLDACLSLEHLIDPHSMFMERSAPRTSAGARDAQGAGFRESADRRQASGFVPDKLPAKDYMDPFINPAKELERQRAEFEKKQAESRGRIPENPTRDVLLFLLRNAPLEDWQSDILSIVRDEAYYFAPQAMTKVMNEGWAVYWHSKLMTQHFVEAKEIIQYADQHSGVLAMPPGGFNPYKIGYELFRDIERRWDRGQHGPAWEALDSLGEKDAFDDSSMKGREKIFEVRRIYNDVQFIDEFLTPEFVERYNMYQYRRDPQTGELKIVSRDFDRIKQTLLFRLTNMGQPFIYVVDGNYRNRGELYLAQQYNGLEVDIAKAREVLVNLRRLWGRPVHVQVRLDDEHHLITCEDGEAIRKERIGSGTAKPAHQIA